MTNQCVSLTNAEWSLMECLWESSPRTGREAVEYLKKRVGWKRSTTLTMLSRMTERALSRVRKGTHHSIFAAHKAGASNYTRNAKLSRPGV